MRNIPEAAENLGLLGMFRFASSCAIVLGMNRISPEPRIEKVHVGRIEIDFLSRRMTRPDGATVTVEPKALTVLEILIGAAGKVVEREVLIDLCWDNYPGADESLTQAISKLRAAFAKLGEHPEAIETIPKRGYRLTAPVREELEPIADQNRSTWSAVSGGWMLFVPMAMAIVAAAVWFLSARTQDRGDPNYAVAILPASGTQIPAPLEASLAAGLSSWGLPIVEDRLEAIYEVRISGHPAEASVVDQTGASLLRIDVPNSTPTQERDAYLSYRLAGTLFCALQLEPQLGAYSRDERAILLQYCSNLHAGETRGLHLISERILATKPKDATAKALHSLALSLDPGATIAPGPGDTAASVRQRAVSLARESLNSVDAPDIARTAFVFAQANILPPAEVAKVFASKPDPGIQATQLRWRQTVFLASTGQLRMAGDLSRQIVSAAPGSALQKLNAAQIAFERGREDQARNLLDHPAMAVRPENFAFLKYAIAFYALPPDEALQVATDFARQRGASVSECDRAYIAVQSGNGQSTSLDTACAQLNPDAAIRMYTTLGNLDRAFALSEKLPVHLLGSARVFYYPEMQPFRSDPRFEHLASKYGLTTYWRDGNWPDFCEADRPRPSVCSGSRQQK